LCFHIIITPKLRKTDGIKPNPAMAAPTHIVNGLGGI